MKKYNCGIYSITNLRNGKIYVGQSENIRSRWRYHKYRLRNNFHDNPYLQNAWNKSGEESFEFKVLLYCNFEDLGFFESRAIGRLKALGRKHGYNLMEPTSGGGFRHSAVSKRKMSEIKMGDKNPMFGRKYSEEEKKKMSEARSGEKHPNFGKHPSMETRKRLSRALRGDKNGFFGKKHSEASKKKMSEARKGRKCSEEEKERMSQAMSGDKNPMFGKRGKDSPNYGSHRSEETKRKMSQSGGGKAFAVFEDGIKVGGWLVQTLCAIDLGLSSRRVNECLHGKRKIHKGYTFKFIEELNENSTLLSK